MKKSALFVSMFLIWNIASQAQTLPVTFVWDPSTTAGVSYRLCWMPVAPPDAAPYPDTRVIHESGPALEYQAQMPTGIFYVFATATVPAMTVDGIPGGLLESGPSNVLRIEVFSPPGRPDKIRIKSVSQVADNGQAVTVRSGE